MKIDWTQIYLIIIIIHAIGHLFPGFIHTFEVFQMGFMPSNESWLLNTQLGLSKSVTRWVSVLFLVESIGFFVVAWMYHTGNELWKILAIPLVIISLFLFVAWFSSFIVNIPIASILGNAVIIWLMIGA